jgi:hypothetical protein
MTPTIGSSASANTEPTAIVVSAFGAERKSANPANATRSPPTM